MIKWSEIKHNRIEYKGIIINLTYQLTIFLHYRSNLDPFLLYTDTQIWDNLRRTMLATSITSLDDLGTVTSII